MTITTAHEMWRAARTGAALGALLWLAPQVSTAQTGPLDDAAPFVAVDVATAGTFATQPAGIACDADGHVYLGNLSVDGTIRCLAADGSTEPVCHLPDGCPAGSMLVRPDGLLLVADPRYHRIVQVDPRIGQVREYARGLASWMMANPRHMALAANGDLYVTDPDPERESGKLWKVTPAGAAHPIAADLGPVTGVALAPGDRTLYVSRGPSGEVWAYLLAPTGRLADGGQRLVHFDDARPDAIAVGAAGELYVALQGPGAVAKVSPAGQVQRRIALDGTTPTAIALGGADGATVFVTLADRGVVQGFRLQSAGSARPLAGSARFPAAPVPWGHLKRSIR